MSTGYKYQYSYFFHFLIQINFMKNNSLLFDNSLNEFKILGSVSPATFKEKLKHVPFDAMKGITAVFSDILRCTTTCIAVAAQGSKGIVLQKKPSEDIFRFEPPCLPNHSWVYGGEKHGLPIKGVNDKNEEIDALISNSPIEVTGKNLMNSFLLFYSSNGALAFETIINAGFDEIYAMAMSNIKATAKAIINSKAEKVWLICSGFYNSVCLEDMIANGALINELVNMGFCSKDEIGDEAESMRLTALNFMEDSKLIPVEVKSRLAKGQVHKLLENLLGKTGDLNACVDGTGMKEIWNNMEHITLVCRDYHTRLLVTENKS